MDRMTISRRLVEDALSNANIHEFNIRDSYSGRAMYGGTCFGVDLETERDSYKFLVALTLLLVNDDDEQGEDNAWRLAECATTDSMGCGMILYFPGVKLEG